MPRHEKLDYVEFASLDLTASVITSYSIHYTKLYEIPLRIAVSRIDLSQGRQLEQEHGPHPGGGIRHGRLQPVAEEQAVADAQLLVDKHLAADESYNFV